MAKRKTKKQASFSSKPAEAKADVTDAIDEKWVILALVLGTFASYALIWNNEFVWDDDPYITLNEAVKSFDLTALLKDFHVGNYHPLTMLTLAIEYAIVGEKPWLFHFNNIVLHIANSWLLYVILKKLKLSQVLAILTALFFALHPLHVESVAWAAERKDVLYTLFLFLSFKFYLDFSGNKSKAKYLFSLLLFVAACLSKGMAVVLPALLIITDWWMLKKPFSVKQLLDKIPYFAVTFFFAWLATTAQKDAGADATSVISAAYDTWERIRIVSYSYLFYWVKTLVPNNLLPFYPYPSKPLGEIPGIFNVAFFGLMCFLVAAFFGGLKNKKIWWAVGFFTIAISTVLQILPVGSAIVADRYYYLSSVGPLFLLAFGITSVFRQKALLIGGIVAALFGVKTFFQVDHWENLFTLFTPAERVYPEDAMVLSNLGWHYLGESEFTKAKEYLIRADNRGFKNADVCRTIGSMYIDEGNLEAAKPYIERAYQYRPVKPRTDWLMALIYQKQSDFNNAFPFAEKAFQADPENQEFKATYASLLTEVGRAEESRVLYQQLGEAENPDNLLNIAFTFKKEGDVQKEIELLKELLLKHPDYLPAYRNLGMSLIETNQPDLALEYWETAAKKDPSGDYEYNIGINYASRNQVEKAIPYYIAAAKKGKQEAIELLRNNNVTY